MPDNFVLKRDFTVWWWGVIIRLHQLLERSVVIIANDHFRGLFEDMSAGVNGLANDQVCRWLELRVHSH